MGAGGWCNSPALVGQIAGSRTLPSHRVAAHCPHGIRRRLYRLSPAAWAKTCIKQSGISCAICAIPIPIQLHTTRAASAFAQTAQVRTDCAELRTLVQCGLIQMATPFKSLSWRFPPVPTLTVPPAPSLLPAGLCSSASVIQLVRHVCLSAPSLEESNPGIGQLRT